MCGIAGIYRFGGHNDDAQVVQTMLRLIERRGPDASGVVQEGAATLGNRRLAILDLSPAGHQPMASADGRFIITFNGEIYNYRDLQKQLGLDGGQLRSHTDTEVILHAWQQWGSAALDKMVGQWAFALLDVSERTLYLCRDRFGEKPLFYHETSDAISFASSIPALMQAPWVPRSLADDAIAEYLTLRYVVAPRTVMTDVHKLPGGHMLRINPDGIDMSRWYVPRFKARCGRSRDDLVDEFDALLKQAADRCLVSDVPVALLLSDGIDSNSVRAALMASGRPIASYTYTLASSGSGLTAEPGGGTVDAPITDLHVTPQDRIDKMVPAFASLTEPVGDGAALATWLLIRNARDHATVFLCGHGGDEVLGGYRLSQDRFRLSLVRQLSHLPTPMVTRLLDRFAYGAEPAGERRQRMIHARADTTPAAARYIIHRPLPLADLDEIGGGRAFDGPRYLSVIDRLYDDGGGGSDVDRMQEVMLRTFLSENILPFADATAMDSSAELRMPFLDRDLVDFVFSLPSSDRVSRWPGRANTKLILRWWGERYLTKDILTLRKRAFNFGNLPELLTDNASVLESRILDSSAVRRVMPGVEQWLRHAPEYYRGPWEGTLWALLALGIWTEQHGVK